MTWMSMNAFLCVCEHMTHMVCAVLCLGTCDKPRPRGWCLCLLMCNSSQCVVHETGAIYSNGSSLCCILCLWKQFSLWLLTLLCDFYQVPLQILLIEGQAEVLYWVSYIFAWVPVYDRQTGEILTVKYFFAVIAPTAMHRYTAARQFQYV